jgi:hypothetical protein
MARYTEVLVHIFILLFTFLILNYPYLLSPYFLFPWYLYEHIESLFHSTNIVFHFLRLLQYVRMLMGHSAAAVCMINMPTGNRKQPCLETKIFFYLFNALLFNSLRFISFCWRWRGGNGLRDHFAAFTRLRNHNTGNCQNTLTWLVAITVTIPALELRKF